MRGRQVNARDRSAVKSWAARMTRFGRAAVGIVDEGHDVAVVLGGVRRGRGEHGLTYGGVAAELVRLHGAVVQVVLEGRLEPDGADELLGRRPRLRIGGEEQIRHPGSGSAKFSQPSELNART